MGPGSPPSGRKQLSVSVQRARGPGRRPRLRGLSPHLPASRKAPGAQAPGFPEGEHELWPQIAGQHPAQWLQRHTHKLTRRDTQAHIETHTGTHTHTHRHTHGHTQRHTGIYRDTHRHTHRHTITQRHTQAHTHTGTYTDTQTHTQTHTGPPKKERSPVCFESVNFICPTSGAKRTLS